MHRRRTLSDARVAALKPRSARYTEPDPELAGHYVRVTPTGGKSFVAVARSPDGKQIWATIGAADLLRIEEARDRAREAIKRIRAGLPAVERGKARQTFADVTAQWLQRHVDVKGLRSAPEIRRLLDAHVLPVWGDREFEAIRRSDVADLLDGVEDRHSQRQADYVLNVVRSICNWFAARSDDYTPPVVRGMRRQDAAKAKRARILDDEEIRLVWREAEKSGPFGALIRMALLTAQRRSKVATMRWADIVGDEWRIATAPREKDSAGSLVLPPPALQILASLPRLNSNPYVFPGRAGGAFAGMSQAKARLDDRIAKRNKKPDRDRVAPWVLHDLRRTARSLMARAGVRPDIAERVLGHVIRGIEGVYDRHSYRDEKADALARLATLIEKIVA